MLFFLALSCLAAAALGSVAVYQRGASNRLNAPDGTARLPPRSSSTGTPGEPRPEVTVSTLEHGDAVLDGNDDWVVVGTLRYREEQETWALHHLDGGAHKRFLEVRTRAGVTGCAFLENVDDAPVHGQLGAGLTYRGQALTLDARGDARTTPSGDTNGRGAVTLKYARYVGPGGALLVVEELVVPAGKAGTRRALFGRTVPVDSLSIYPHP